MKKITEADASMAVDCPVCFAEPGCACCTPEGVVAQAIHESRVNDFRDLVAEARAELRDARFSA